MVGDIKAKPEREFWRMTGRETRKQPNFFDSLLRMGTGRETKYPFLTDDIRIATEYSGEPTLYLVVQFQNPLYVDTRMKASEILLGENIYPSGKGKAGRFGPVEKAILDADGKIGAAALKKGYDAIITPSEVQVLDKSVLPAPVRAYWDKEIVDWRLEDGSIWTDVSGHRNIVKQALAEGQQVPSEVLKEYPDLQQARE